MNVIGEAAYKVTADTSGFQRQAETGVGSAMRTIGRAGLVAAAGGITAAFVGMGFAVRRGFNEFTQSQRVMAQTRAVLESTGGAAGVTGRAVTDLASRMSRLTGIDDETIQASENLLLTFTNVRDYVDGKFIGTFTDAETAIADMATALASGSGGEVDLQSATIMVGKALQDPVRGMTALRRVGVNFSDAQADVIQKLVETGHAAEAQRLILAELNREFGGSAKAAGDTMVGALSKMNNAFDEAFGSMVATAAPALTSLAGGLQHFAEFLQRVFAHEQLSVRLRLIWEGVTSVASDLWDAFVVAWEGTAASREPIKVDGKNIAFEGTPATEGLGQRIRDALEAVDWEQVGQRIGDGIRSGTVAAFTGIDWGGLASLAGNAFIEGWRFQIENLSFQFLGIGPALIDAFTSIDWGAVDNAIDEGMTSIRIGFEDWLQEQIGSVNWGGLGATIVGGLAAGIAGAAGLLLGGGQSLISKFLQPWQLLPQVMGGIGGSIIGSITNALSSLGGRVVGIFSGAASSALGILRGLVGSAGGAAASVVNAIVNAFSSVVGRVVGALGRLPGAVAGAIGRAATSAFTAAVGIGASIVQGIISGISGLASTLYGAVRDLAGNALQSGLDFIQGHSPSELFAKQMGEPIAQGIALGITRASGLVDSAVIGAVTPPGVPSSPGSLATVSAGTVNTRTMHIGQVVLPGVRSGQDMIRQLDALVTQPG